MGRIIVKEFSDKTEENNVMNMKTKRNMILQHIYNFQCKFYFWIYMLYMENVKERKQKRKFI